MTKDEKKLREIADFIYDIGKTRGITDLKNYATDLHAIAMRSEARTPACEIPPPGWVCTREAGHDPPCAAVLVASVHRSPKP